VKSGVVKIELNGTSTGLTPATTLLALIESCAGTTRGAAAVVDGDVVPRSQWPEYHLRDGQRVELITAVPGG
jgi:sulfur carrier protein